MSADREATPTSVSASSDMPASAKRPAYQWYPGDFHRDTALQACSFEARALWRAMLDLMHDGEPYGHLSAGGVPIDPAELARMEGVSAANVRRWLQELDARKVFSRTEAGVIYSRRMVRDEHKRSVRAAGGRQSLKNPNVPRPKHEQGPIEGYPLTGPSSGPSSDPSPCPSGGPLQFASASASASALQDQQQQHSRKQRAAPNKSAPPDERVATVLAHYQLRHPRRHPGSAKDCAAITRALGTYSVDDLCAAIDANASDPWHADRRKHELTYVLRDSSKIDEFLDVARNPPRLAHPVRRGSATDLLAQLEGGLDD